MMRKPCDRPYVIGRGRRGRSALVAAGLAVALFGMSACGGAASTQTSSSSSKAPAAAAGSSKNPALYQGSDRQAVLVAGARKEGNLYFYTSPTGARAVLMNAFEKKYPFIKVHVYRAGSEAMLNRVQSEYQARRYNIDVIEITPPAMVPFENDGILQPFYSPQSSAYPSDVKFTGSGGSVYAIGTREFYTVLAYNTKLLSKSQVPQNYGDLINPKWKGKLTISGDSGGVQWLGNLDVVKGLAFVKKLAKENVHVQMMSGRALLNLIISGEVPISPTIYMDHVQTAMRKGAPVNYIPLQPVVAGVAYVGLAKKAPDPDAALLLIDFLLSKQGQTIYAKLHYSSARLGMAPHLKRSYLEHITGSHYLQKEKQWGNLMQNLFIK